MLLALWHLCRLAFSKRNPCLSHPKCIGFVKPNTLLGWESNRAGELTLFGFPELDYCGELGGCESFAPTNPPWGQWSAQRQLGDLGSDSDGDVDRLSSDIGSGGRVIRTDEEQGVFR